jgi:hypothetical protein
MIKTTKAIFLLASPGLLALLIFLQFGCGKKMWPEPRAEQDRFSWAVVNGTRAQGCLEIYGRLQGAYHNLAKLKLELEGSPEGQFCPTCPFLPDSEVSFPVSSAQVKRKGPLIEIRYCGLSPEMKYRWRLQGVNVFRELGQATSQVSIAENKQETK